ncbi:MAG: putative quinol monooxygenase [Emergencia sp.]|nr:putative quinol monooxygenase [Emergencia sp.]
MTNFYVTYKLKDRETRDAFYQALCASGAAEKSRAEDGCIRYAYFYPAEQESHLFLWEQWENRAAQKAHTAQPHFLEIGKLKEDYGAETEVSVEDAV